MICQDNRCKMGRFPHLEPDNDEIPKPNHGNFGWGVSSPRFGIFDGDHIHEVEDILHGHVTEDKSNQVHDVGTICYRERSSVL